MGFSLPVIYWGECSLSKLSSQEDAVLKVTASRLGVNPDDLYKLINFESGWRPAAANPYSSAKGLIQFTDKTARSLGYSDSANLVDFNPTRIDQLPLVEKYLSQFKPFSGKQSLYLAVFYPAARNWLPGKLFPEAVRKVNPGINTPGDYVKKVEGGKTTIAAAAIAATLGLFFLMYFRKGL